MAKDSSKLLFAGDGEVYLAPLATVMPIDVATALSVTWLDGGLGYMAEGGVTISADISTNETRAWQTADPIAERVEQRTIMIQAGVLQFNPLSFQVLFAGGTWTGTTLRTFTPPSGSQQAEWAMVVETIEATKKMRWLFPKVAVSDTGELKMDRPEAANAAVSWKALNTGSAPTFTTLTDYGNFVTA
jgi:hypothetical protein